MVLTLWVYQILRNGCENKVETGCETESKFMNKPVGSSQQIPMKYNYPRTQILIH